MIVARVVQEGASIQQSRFIREIRFASALDDDFFQRTGIGIAVMAIVVVVVGGGPVEAGNKGDDRDRHGGRRHGQLS